MAHRVHLTTYSGMSGMDNRIHKACKGSTALKGFAIYGHEAQNDRPGTKQKVLAWLKDYCFRRYFVMQSREIMMIYAK